MKWSPDGKKLGIKSKVEREDGRYEIQIYSRLGQYIKSVHSGWAFSASALVPVFPILHKYSDLLSGFLFQTLYSRLVSITFMDCAAILW